MHRTIRIEAAVPVELAEQFRRVARDYDRSATAHLRHLVREHVIENSEAPVDRERSAKPAGGDGRHERAA